MPDLKPSPAAVDLPHTQDAWRVLTVQQPWADFLVPDETVEARLRRVRMAGWADALPKPVENRTQAHSWRGWTLIQSSGWDRRDRAAIARFGLGPVERELLYGTMVGAARMVNCTPPAEFATEAKKAVCPSCRTTSAKCYGQCCPGCKHEWQHPLGVWAAWDQHQWHMTEPIRLANPIGGLKGQLGLIKPGEMVLGVALARFRCQLGAV